MKIERDERKFDFHGIGLAIKKAREREGMTQEQLGYIVDRDPRTIMYHENDGQHPSLNAFYQMVTMFGISVDEYAYPDMGADEAAKKRINIQLNGRGQQPRHGNVGANLLEHDILIPQPQADMLLREAAGREVSAEELLAEIIRKYIERNERNGG